MMNRSTLFLAMLFCLGLLAGCASETGIERFNNLPAKTIFEGGEQSLAGKHYSDAIDHFEAIQAMYPYGEYAEQTGLNIIYAYYMDDQYDAAITAANRYLQLYPQGTHADYAYYMKGIAEYRRDIGFFERYLPIDRSPRDLTSWQLTFHDFNNLLAHYPNSDYAADARLHMIYLRDEFAQHQLGIANYYYSREAYIAAITRAQFILMHLQQTSSVGPALVLMFKAYQALSLPVQAAQSLAVLQLNYPDLASQLTK